MNRLSKTRINIAVFLIASGCGLFAAALGPPDTTWRLERYVSQTFEFACRYK